jgi:hypothetical protein
MTTSETIKEISTALVAFHREVGKISKDSVNPHFKNRYASLSNILEAIQEPLTKSGLSVVQFPEGQNVLTTRLIHVSGEWLEASYEMKPVKDDPQGRGSAMTYQRRYALGAILALNIDDDDDANAASTPPQKQPEKPWLNENSEAFEKALKAIAEKTVTIAQIKAKYRLAKSTEEKLIAAGN